MLVSKFLKEQIKKDIYEYIRANGVMTLATQSSSGPWACTVYYGIDSNMNLYIVTDPDSVHGKNIQKNNEIAFNIYDSHQKIDKPKKGVQGKGRIEMVRGVLSVTKGLMLWHKQNPGVEKKLTVREVKKFKDTKVYKITPYFLKYFNKSLYPDTEYEIWEK